MSLCDLFRFLNLTFPKTVLQTTSTLKDNVVPYQKASLACHVI